MNEKDDRNEHIDGDVGPLGAGQEPVKDPMKGLQGVQAAALSMQAISFFLVLTVIGRVDDGAYWTTFNWIFVTVLASFMFVFAFMQRLRFALPVDLVVQVIAVVGGFFIHPSMVVVAVVFLLVWWYILHLRSNLIARMKRGLLTTQHLGT